MPGFHVSAAEGLHLRVESPCSGQEVPNLKGMLWTVTQSSQGAGGAKNETRSSAFRSISNPLHGLQDRWSSGSWHLPFPEGRVVGSGTTLLSEQPPWTAHLYPPDSGKPGRKAEVLYVPDKTAVKGL